MRVEHCLVLKGDVKMKQWYDGWETTDKLAEAGIKFENDFPYRNM